MRVVYLQILPALSIAEQSGIKRTQRDGELPTINSNIFLHWREMGNPVV